MRGEGDEGQGAAVPLSLDAVPSHHLGRYLGELGDGTEDDDEDDDTDSTHQTKILTTTPTATTPKLRLGEIL